MNFFDRATEKKNTTEIASHMPKEAHKSAAWDTHLDYTVHNASVFASVSIHDTSLHHIHGIVQDTGSQASDHTGAEEVA